MWWSPWCQGSKSRCCWYQWRWREYGRNYTSWATRIAKLCPPGKNLSGPLTHITRYQPKCPKTSKGASKHLTTSFILRGCKDCQTLKKNWSIVTTDATVSLLLAQFPGGGEDTVAVSRWRRNYDPVTWGNYQDGCPLSTVSRHDSDVLKEREPTAGSGQHEPWPSYY